MTFIKHHAQLVLKKSSSSRWADYSARRFCIQRRCHRLYHHSGTHRPKLFLHHPSRQKHSFLHSIMQVGEMGLPHVLRTQALPGQVSQVSPGSRQGGVGNQLGRQNRNLMPRLPSGLVSPSAFPSPLTNTSPLHITNSPNAKKAAMFAITKHLA